MRHLTFRTLWLAPLAATLAACGGGGSADSSAGDATFAAATTDTPAERASALAAAPSAQSQRLAAARATAESSSNDCASVRPFYWELGTSKGRSASGSVGTDATGAPITAKTAMPYASASKWLYGAYVAQKRQGVLSSTDVHMLTFRSGYTSFKGCEPGQTVDACLAARSNGQYSAATDGAFYYGGGHMQKHASMNGLGSADSLALVAAMKSQLGSDLVIGYSQPQLAGGAYGNSQVYAAFLRKLLGGKLALGGLLGTTSACASPASCPAREALASPAPPNETWRYSLGHWVESDPRVGDGAFSSGGAFGFYPWVDAGRTRYGIVARNVANGGQGSMICGRLIRKAWTLGVAQ